MNPTPSRERVCLLTGGGYPYRRDALSGWCRTLVEGLRRFRFELLTVTDREPPSAPAYPLPFNVRSARAVAIDRSSARPERRRGDSDDRVRSAAALLSRGLLGDRDTESRTRGAREPGEPGDRGDHPGRREARSPSNGLGPGDGWGSEGRGGREGEEAAEGWGVHEGGAREALDGRSREARDGRSRGAGDGRSREAGNGRSREAGNGRSREAGNGRSPGAEDGRFPEAGDGREGGVVPADLVFSEGLRQIAELAAERPAILASLPLADALAEAWRSEGRLSMRDARTAATLLRHALGALTVPMPEADLVHCVGGTTPLLTALAGRWRTGTPLLLTEARTPVARHKPHEERLSPAVRTVLRRFRGAVARTGYAEAGLIAPLSAYHHSWALRHGAQATKLVQVPAGVDPSEYPGAAELDTEPAVVWAGSGGPDSGLTPLLAAFEQVVAAVPSTVLHLVGVTAAHEDHCAEQIERMRLGRAVRLHPLPADPRDRYTAGHVVAHVPGPADPPYRLIEAMMSGRAVVGVDVGPAAETLGDAGVLVQPGDPAELAIAVTDLLRSPSRRRQLGDAARRRALTHFTNDRVVRVYGALYSDLAAPPPAAAFELALAVPAPRSEPPVTLRWLVREDR
ncbi:DUF3492 domain-containing protein [Paractinoplanes atraurantiacus]|uniref:Glycosyltransferase involved in cell wall bisynthesis n=1 Tax=Paractinoplanes atraurantiacus TaxID=1036182 RepID=A0A285FSA7_9ACTN|nr:DUF3492 domain-containing protein [Actinoplanes atraurantiacus]SNY14177.1 Glycosyltransferase involved in cell wall bisynthesis [Actinoplanes atraurantiacus]